MKILIIEDEQLLADSIAEVLRRKGFEAEAVYDGETGAEYAELGVYDLLILDVMMPGLDGYTVARQVRARHLGTPILMLTARSGLEDRITGLNAGPTTTSPSLLTPGSCWPASTPCCAGRRPGQSAHPGQYISGSVHRRPLLRGGQHPAVRQGVRHHAAAPPGGRAQFVQGGPAGAGMGYDSDAVENHVEVYVCFLRKKLASIGSNIRIESIRRLGYHLEVSGDD